MKVDLPNFGGQVGQLYVRHKGDAQDAFRPIWHPHALDRDLLESDAVFLRIPYPDGASHYVRLDTVLDSLAHFIMNIEVTGGVQRARDGTGLEADPEWLDLADTYTDACARLGRGKVVRKVRRTAKRKYANSTLL